MLANSVNKSINDFLKSDDTKRFIEKFLKDYPEFVQRSETGLCLIKTKGRNLWFQYALAMKFAKYIGANIYNSLSTWRGSSLSYGTLD